MSAMPAIEKAIRESDLGVNPSNDGKLIRCVFPELTEERRKEYIKVAKTKAEDGRVAVRNIRRNAKQTLEKLEKDGEVGKDDVTGAEKRLDATTKKHTDQIDEMLKHKEVRAARGVSHTSEPTPMTETSSAPAQPGEVPEATGPGRPQPPGRHRLRRRARWRDHPVAGVLDAGVHVRRGAPPSWSRSGRCTRA